MKPERQHLIGIAVFSVLYAVLAYGVSYIPNPMVNGAILALNMIFPVLAGYFYGPVSGAFAGACGTALAALLRANQFDVLAIFPHMMMGMAAGFAGKTRSEILGAATIIVGHILNMLFYARMGLVTIEPAQINSTLLGLATETTVDIVLIVLGIVLFKQWLYQDKRV